MDGNQDLAQLVTDTFVAHEHLAPNEDAVLSAVRSRAGQGRTGLPRVLAVAASAAVVAGAAGAATVLSEHHGNSRHAPAPAAIQSAQLATAAVSRPADQIAALTMPYDLGWLPDGTADYLARRINVGAVSQSGPPLFDGEYMLTVATADGTMDIDVQQMPGGLDDAAFKSGPGEATTIDGRAAVQSSNAGGPAGYEVYFEDSAGALMYVGTSAANGESLPASELISAGRGVAEHVQFPGTTQVTPTFGIGYVPDGMSVRAFDVEDGSTGLAVADASASGPSTTYEIGTTTDFGSAATVSQSDLPSPGGTPGRTVQGHRTEYTDEGGYHLLAVLDAVNGEPVTIGSHLPLDEMYRIAEGLQLP